MINSDDLKVREASEAYFKNSDLRSPRSCIKAFARGRRSQGVFSYSSAEPLLEEVLGNLRKRTTAPESSVYVNTADITLFFFFVFASIAIHFLPLIAIVLAFTERI